MFNGWKITNILDVGLCELDTADGPYNKTGYRLEHRRDGFAVTVGLMEHITADYVQGGRGPPRPPAHATVEGVHARAART